MKARRALMAGVLVNLAGWESSWKWTEGIDVTNPSSALKLQNEEAGLFQTSGNTMDGFGKGTLKAKFLEDCKGYPQSNVYQRFIACSKDPGANRRFVVEYTAMVLRFTTNHHGPIKRKQDVYTHLPVDCVEQIRARL
jgi:hypothetical protein